MHQRGKKAHLFFQQRDWFCFLGTKEIKLTWIYSKVMACWGESRWTETHGTGCPASNKGLNTNKHSLLQKNIVSSAQHVYVVSLLLLLNQLSLGVSRFHSNHPDFATISISQSCHCCQISNLLSSMLPSAVVSVWSHGNPPAPNHLHFITSSVQAKLIRGHYSSLQDHQHSLHPVTSTTNV